MSKMDALRAMREARYAEGQSRGQTPTPAKRPAAPRPDPKVAAPEPPVLEAVDAESTTDELCGHRNMGGRTCTREQGHSAKSHRYS